MIEQMVQPEFVVTQANLATEEVYAPPGGRNYAPAANASLFRCAPSPVAVSPATHLPQRTDRPDAATRTALQRNGCSAAQVATFEQRGGLPPLQPVARLFGVDALAELMARLRYTPARLVNPPHTYGANLNQRLGTQFAAPHLAARLLLAIPGHFRELARRAPDAREAHALESLGWLLMRSLRSEVRDASQINYWLPPAPRFVTAFPNPVPAFSQQVQRLILRRLLVDTSLTMRDYQARLEMWNNALAGRTWALETGQQASNAGPGLPFYAELVTIPQPVNTTAQRQQIDQTWAQRKFDTDQKHTLLTEPSTQRLLACKDAMLPAGLIQVFRLPNIRLAFHFPMRQDDPEIRSMRVLSVIRPTAELLFETVRDLGWNDLVFQLSGGFCFRGTRGPNRHFDARVISKHGYGLAFDINVVENPQRRIGVMDPRVVALFEAFHFRWGRCFHTPDPHHFEYCGSTC